MDDVIHRQDAIDVIHKTIFDFFDIVDDDDESPMTYKDEQLLTLNKAIVTKIEALPSAQPDVPESCVGNMISRQAAIDTVRSYYDECDEREESIEERIERLPSADIDLSGFSDKLWKTAYERGKAEVVRCKDCKSFSHGYCKFHDAKFVREDGYCYWGERKDGCN